MTIIKTISSPKALEWILRVSACLCFVGHGAFGFITKEDWIPFFAVVGIDRNTAFALQPLIGTMDVALGVSVLFFPIRAVFAWMAIWTIWTAMLRPLDGRGIWEFFERGGNYGVPIAALAWVGFNLKLKNLFSKIEFKRPSSQNLKLMEWTLRITVFLTMVGHGGFGLFMKKQMLINHFAAVGIHGGDGLLMIFGACEIALGFAALCIPYTPVLLLICLWKVMTELLYPISGDYIWEFIERFGSYASPLALVVVYRLMADGKHVHASNHQQSSPIADVDQDVA